MIADNVEGANNICPLRHPSLFRPVAALIVGAHHEVSRESFLLFREEKS